MPLVQKERNAREMKKDMQLRELMSSMDGGDQSRLALIYLAILKYENRTGDLKEIVADKEDLKDLLPTFKFYIDKKMHRIDRLVENYDIDVLERALVYEDIYNNRTELTPLPESYFKLAKEFLDLSERDVLLDIGSGKGEFLLSVLADQKVKRAYGLDASPEANFSSRVRAHFLNEEVDFRRGDILRRDYKHLKANKIFSSLPFGMRPSEALRPFRANLRLSLFLEANKIKVDNDWFFVLAASQILAPGGKFTFYISQEAMASGSGREIREALVEKGLLEGVIELPTGLLPLRSLPGSMVVISQGNRQVRMVDARKFSRGAGMYLDKMTDRDITRIKKCYREDTKYSRSVGFEEIADRDYGLSPIGYIETEEERVNNLISPEEKCKGISTFVERDDG